jgi:putative ABC transport system permease protein
MTGNFIKVAVRIFLKYKSYTLINVFVLAIGLACSIIIFLYVENEYSFDHFHQHAKNIYRIGIKGNVSGNTVNHAVTPAPLASALVNEVPGVKKAVRIGRFGAWLVRYDTIKHNEDGIIFADSTFFEIFSFPLLAGDPLTILDKPENIVLSETAVKRYFGNENPIGKKLRIENDSTFYVVSGVMKDVPPNSHMHFDMVASLSTLYKYLMLNSWVANYFYTYILVEDNTNRDDLSAKVNRLAETYVRPAYLNILSLHEDQTLSYDDRFSFIIQPMLDIHLKSDFEAEFEPVNNINYIYIFSALAILILIVACINFINLATATTANRAKEVGIRKITGSDKKLLFRQFMTESFLLTFLSLILALLFVEILLPLFNKYIDLNLSLGQLVTPLGFIILFLLVAVVGTFAGFYPAFLLSSFDPIVILRSWVGQATKSSFFRKGLVFFQFLVTITILVMTFILYEQFNFLINKDLGFDTKDLLIIRRPDGLKKDLEKYREAILKHNNVISATNTMAIPGNIVNSTSFYIEGSSPDSNYHLIYHIVNYDFLKTYGLSLSSGRFFDPEIKGDTAACIINETAAKLMKIDNPEGKKLVQLFSKSEKKTAYDIIGVVKDFNFQSLENPIKAMVILLIKGNPEGYLAVKISPQQHEKTINFLKAEWEKFTSNYPFVYFFMEDKLNEEYADVRKTARIFMILSVIAIFIACLGLFGLVSHTTGQRTREIGIRKALGASVFKIYFLELKEILLLIFISSLFAWPLAYFMANSWLKSFYYRIALNPWHFIFSMLIVLIIAFLTVSRQMYQSAKMNPAKAVRYE